MLSERLKGKVAVVTGTGNGIGKGVALMLARHGARVMGCDIDVAAAAATVAEAQREGLPVESVQPCDLTKPDDVQKLMDTAVQRYGGMDALVNAGAVRSSTLRRRMPTKRYRGVVPWRIARARVLAMTRQLAMEGGPHNIRANSISPGMIVTAATKPVLEQPGFLEHVLEKKMITMPKAIRLYAAVGTWHRGGACSC